MTMKPFALMLMLAAATVGGLTLGQVVAPNVKSAKPTVAPATATSGPSAVVVAPTKTALRELKWDDLTPKDWDPLKQFRDTNFGALNDADPKAIAMLQRMRETWDNAPTNSTLDGQLIRIAGYLVPLDETLNGLVNFLLVPYFGACIHTPPPPSNQIIDVRPKLPTKGWRPMDTVWVSGTLRTLRSETYMGVSSYKMDALSVEPYVKTTTDR
jgi:hypothetical protein